MSAEHPLQQLRDAIDRLEERVGATPGHGGQVEHRILDLDATVDDLELQLHVEDRLGDRIHDRVEGGVAWDGPLRDGRHDGVDDFNRSLDANLETTLTGLITAANDAAGRLMAEEVGALVGTPLQLYVARTDLPVFNARLRAIASGQSINDWELDIAGPTGDFAPVSVHAHPVLDRHDVGVAIRWSLRDARDLMRSRRATDRALQSMTEELRQLKDLDRWTQVMITASLHDLRGPIAQIRTAAAQIEDAEDEEQCLVALGYVTSAATSMARLVEHMSALAQGMRHTLLMAPEPVEVSATVEDVVGGIDPKGRAVHLDTVRAHAKVDVRRVTQIIDNLVRNAVRHTPEGATIWVACHPVRGGVIIRVEDSGPGIPDADKARVFTPFVTVGREGGLGVGLSVVALFARLHGGRAWVEDRDGGGASFAVFLPSVPDARRMMGDEDDPLLG